MKRIALNLFLSCFLATVAWGAKTQPNIVFIEVDDLPAHYVGAMGAGFAKTPTIDALAERGILFTGAVCQGTQCGPSRNSLIVGQYPHNIGMYQNGPFHGLPNGTWALPGALQRAGYRTAHIGKSHIHPSKEGLTGTREEIATEGHRRLGFDYVWQSLGRAVVGGADGEKGHDRYIDFLLESGHFEQMKSDRGKTTSLPDDIYLDGLFTKLASEFIADQGAQPYFLWLNYSVPHGPYDVKQSYHDQFVDAEMPPPSAADDTGEGIPALLRPSLIKSKEKNLEAQYGNCASIAFLDDQVASVLVAIDASGMAANTIVVFFSDHGILVGEHGLTHKSTLYREVLNPTLLIADPRSAIHKAVDRPVQLLDIVKTTLDWAGADEDEKSQSFGESLLPLLTGEGKYSADFAVGESPGYYALVTERYKYIAPFDYNKEGKVILFDLKANPEETVNVAEQNPEVIARFKKKAADWLAESGDVVEQAPVPTKEEKRARNAAKAAKARKSAE
jgi:arylsulfatase A-like enzyme